MGISLPHVLEYFTLMRLCTHITPFYKSESQLVRQVGSNKEQIRYFVVLVSRIFLHLPLHIFFLQSQYFAVLRIPTQNVSI